MHFHQWRLRCLALGTRFVNQGFQAFTDTIALGATIFTAAIAAFIAQQQTVLHHFQQPEVLLRAL